MELAAGGLFRAKWTDKIHEEWIRAVLKNRPDLKLEQLERTKELMNSAILDCLVEQYEGLLPSLNLPDEDDRHVLAAAIHSHSNAIVTFNVKDFPQSALLPYNIEAQHPDEFLYHQFGLDHAAIVIAAQRCRKRLKRPPLSAEEYLRSLESQGLVKTVGRLADYAAVI